MAIKATVYYFSSGLPPKWHIAVELIDIDTGMSLYCSDDSKEADMTECLSFRASGKRYETDADRQSLADQLIEQGKLIKIEMPIIDTDFATIDLSQVARVLHRSDGQQWGTQEDEESLTVPPKQAPAEKVFAKVVSSHARKYNFFRDNCAHTARDVLAAAGYKIKLATVRTSLEIALTPLEVALAANDYVHEDSIKQSGLLIDSIKGLNDASLAAIKQLFEAELNRLELEQQRLKLMGLNQAIKAHKIAMFKHKLLPSLALLQNAKQDDEKKLAELAFVQTLLSAIEHDNGRAQQRLRTLAAKLDLPCELKQYAETLNAVYEFRLKGKELTQSADLYVKAEGHKILRCAAELTKKVKQQYITPAKNRLYADLTKPLKDFGEDGGPEIIHRHRKSLLGLYDQIKVFIYFVILGKFDPEQDYFRLFPSKTKRVYDKVSGKIDALGESPAKKQKISEPLSDESIAAKALKKSGLYNSLNIVSSSSVRPRPATPDMVSSDKGSYQAPDVRQSSQLQPQSSPILTKRLQAFYANVPSEIADENDESLLWQNRK